MAIDIDSKKTYLGITSVEALELARQNHPNKVFYVVKIGFDVAETMAKFGYKAVVDCKYRTIALERV